MKGKHKNFPLILFSTLSGFLLANLFGTFLTVLRSCLVWDGFIIIGLVFFVEVINLIVYKIFKEFQKGGRGKGTESFRIVIIRKSLNSFKLGFLLGFFVEAFKVGS